MWAGLPLFPDQASSVAGSVDALFLFLSGVSIIFSALIAGVLGYFAVRYHRQSEDERPPLIHGSLALELTWTLIPLGIVTIVFVWSSSLYYTLAKVPDDAMEIRVVGKRWMWKLQHVTGQREINELHVPLGIPVKLTLTSEDVIHSFFVPAFRIKKDAVPGRYTTAWFTASRPGRYHLFCAEYCGTKHSGMIGWIVVQEPAEFQAWLSGGPQTASLASTGERIFQELACHTCHQEGDTGRGPSLVGLYGAEVGLADGSSVVIDDAYLRESIVTPSAKIAEGYQPIMPTFQGLVSEEGLMQLIAYIKTLRPADTGAPEAAAAGVAP